MNIFTWLANLWRSIFGGPAPVPTTAPVVPNGSVFPTLVSVAPPAPQIVVVNPAPVVAGTAPPLPPVIDPPPPVTALPQGDPGVQPVLILTNPLPDPAPVSTSVMTGDDMPLVPRTPDTNRLGAAQSVTFTGINGINIMWPFMGPTVVNPNDPNTAYSVNPFQNPQPWASHVTPATLAALVAKGFDFIRLPVAPGPWIDALGDATRTETLFQLYDQAVNACLAAGLAVNIDLHDAYYVKNTPQQLLGAGPTAPLFMKRIQVTHNFAARYSKLNPAMVSLELFNEPLDPGEIKGDWLTYLNPLYAAARSAMPNHTLMLSMENWSDVDHLLRADPTQYDANTLWVQHPYIPAIFAEQGYPAAFSKYVTGLSWPPDATQKLGAIAAMTAAVNADPTLTAAQKTAQIASTATTLGWFFSLPENKTRLNTYLAPVLAWCTKYKMTPNRIMCNEYGVTRDSAQYKGAPPASRVAWLNSMADLLNNAGFRKAVFALDAIDYGITDNTSSGIGNMMSSLTGA